MDEPCIMETTIKRGTGTRDEDKHTIRGVGEDATEAINEFNGLKQELEKWVDECRGLQPDMTLEVTAVSKETGDEVNSFEVELGETVETETAEWTVKEA